MRTTGAPTTYDIVQFGATGFAGRLTAEYLAANAPDDLRWALAGRDATRLEEVAGRIAEIAPGRTPPEVIEVQLGDQPALDALAAQTRLILTTVGPYAEHGEPLVAAAAKAGADYVDITGEPQFVDAMYLRYHDTAKKTGARLVHCAGFDSVPHDLGALFTVRQLPDDAPISLTGAVRSNGTFSGGTYQSALGGIAALGESRKLARQRRTREREEAGSTTRRQRPVARPPRRDHDTGRWLAPLPTIDPAIVLRSAAALPEYGPDFEYDHTMATKRLATVVATGIAVSTLALAVKIPPVRRALKGIKGAGTGPDAERRAKSRFTVRFTGEGGGRRVVTEVRGGDPGYDETAKMLAETALSLVFDDNPDRSGQLTTAVACGDNLLSRLQRAGIEFEIIEPAPAGSR